MARSVTGVDATKRALRELERRTSGGVQRIIQAVTVEMHGEAVENVPVDQGKLRQAMFFKVAKFKGTVGNNELYAGFQEFGTGAKVSVPAELQDVANSIKGTGRGDFDQFLDNIRDWCRRHGIDEKAAYPIAASILKRGIAPQPFLYPAFVKGKQKFLSLIENLARTVR